MRSKTQVIVIQALLLALSIILTRFASIRVAIGGVEGIRIGFGTLPIIMTGVFFGPLAGILVGVSADIVGYVLSPMGPYMPHFTLIAALYGLVPGLLTVRPLSGLIDARFGPMKTIILGITLSQVLGGLFLTPYFLHILFEIPWKILIIPRLISTPIQIVLYGYLFYLLIKVPSFSAFLSPCSHDERF
ncbi:MAG TPA: folate family ECF transporter S component [Atribacteraceae bacterium]|nr:folate family ECF transporter S component [Atribacteraceae bacterium]